MPEAALALTPLRELRAAVVTSLGRLSNALRCVGGWVIAPFPLFIFFRGERETRGRLSILGR